MFNWKETSGIFEVKVEVMENKTRGSRNNTKSEIIESKSKCPKGKLEFDTTKTLPTNSQFGDRR